jgi:hypothetical protein
VNNVPVPAQAMHLRNSRLPPSGSSGFIRRRPSLEVRPTGLPLSGFYSLRAEKSVSRSTGANVEAKMRRAGVDG